MLNIIGCLVNIETGNTVCILLKGRRIVSMKVQAAPVSSLLRMFVTFPVKITSLFCTGAGPVP